MDTASTSQYYVQTLASGLKLLEVLSQHPNIPLAELAGKADLGMTQTFRLLHTLEANGYIHKSEIKTYRLGAHCITLGHAAHRNLPIIVQSRDVLDFLVEASGESSHLVIRHGLMRVIADMRDSAKRVRASAPIGQEDPLYYGGTGLTILAYSAPAIVQAVLEGEMKPLTSTTLTDRAGLRHILQEIQRLGYHVAREDFKVGAFSVAAPIFEATGECNAAICVAGPADRLTKASEVRFRELVVDAAAEISQRLGYAPQHIATVSVPKG